MKETLGEQLVPADSGEVPLGDRRAWVRYAADQETCCHTTAADRGDFLSARIVDMSATGLGLELGRRVRPGTRLAVELIGQKSRRSFTHFVQVVRNQPAGERRWIVGCIFESEISPEDLLDLLWDRS